MLTHWKDMSLCFSFQNTSTMYTYGNDTRQLCLEMPPIELKEETQS